MWTDTAQGFLNDYKVNRKPVKLRAEKIANKLEKCGFEGVLTRAKALAGVGQVTRAHFARVLVNNYGVPSMERRV